MLDETATEGVPPVPSVWRLGWLLFMQPLALHRMHRAWGLKDPSGITLWRRARTHDSIARALLAKSAFCLLITTPLFTGLVASALALAGVAVDASHVAASVAFGAAFGVAASAAASVGYGVALGVAFGVVEGMGFGPGAGGAAGVVAGGALGVGAGVVFGVGAGVVFGLAVGVTAGRTGIHPGAAWLGVVPGVVFGVVAGVGFGVAFGVAFTTMCLRLPLWLAEAAVTWLMSWRMRRRPVTAHRLASWLPFRHDDLIYLPLPGLRACLLEVAEIDAALARELLAAAAASVGQRRIARRALTEL